jgi:hypothetical protein
MRAISENLLNKIQSDTRAYDIMLTVYHRYIDADGNISFDTSTDYSSNAELLGVSGLQGATTGYLQLGKTFVSEIDFSLTKNAVCRVGDKVKLWLDFGDGDTITLAKAYVDTVSHDQWQSNFTAYDKMMQLNKAYISKLTYPASASAVVDEICEQTGLELEPFVFECNPTLKVAPVSPNTDYNGNSVYYSYREILGYIALANASNIVIDEETERLKFVKYTDSGSTFDYNKTIRRTINNENYVINAIKVSDTGYSEGNEKGEFEVFFPLVTTQGKEYVYSYLSTHFVGLSYIGMTAQKQGYGIYQIGDLVDYADFDGENYTFAVMGVKYDFSGGYFTEQLYSLAPSEMEAEYSGGIYAGQSNTNIKNPVIVAEKNQNYLKYEYATVGYFKGDELTYGAGNNNAICHGYVVHPTDDKGSEVSGLYSVVYFPKAKTTVGKGELVTDVKIYQETTSITSGGTEYRDTYIEYVKADGTPHKYKYSNALAVNTNRYKGLHLSWLEISTPDSVFVNGSVRISFMNAWESEGGGLNFHSSGASVIDLVVGFKTLNEYNVSVLLTTEPLELYDVTQSVLQVVESETVANLPEIGEPDTMYVTYQPPAVYKYSVPMQRYYCVGRDYKQIQQIKSSTKKIENDINNFYVPIVFDVRTKAEWELESNTVFPKGFVIFEQEPETREKTRIKIANGIDKLSDLTYNGIDASALDEKADKTDLQAHIDDKANPHGVTKEQIGLSKVEDKSSSEILSELQIHGRNYIVDSGKALTLEGKGLETSATKNMQYPDIETAESLDGKTVTISFDYENNVTEGQCDFRRNLSWGLILRFTPEQNVGKGSHKLTFTMGDYEHTNTAAVYLQGAFSGTVTIKNLKLELGDKATDWSVAPEDVARLEQRVATLEAALLSLGGEI